MLPSARIRFARARIIFNLAICLRGPLYAVSADKPVNFSALKLRRSAFQNLVYLQSQTHIFYFNHNYSPCEATAEQSNFFSRIKHKTISTAIKTAK